MDREQTTGPAGDASSNAQVRGGANTAGPAEEQTVNETTNQSPATATAGEPASASAQTPAGPASAPAEPVETEAVVAGEVVAGEAPVDGGVGAAEPEVTPLGAELGALRSELDERTGDLQRVTAEYANYRKRVERDRLVVAEQATAQVIATLLPVLDDLDRAREHGDLVGPFATMAEQLNTALVKFGLTGFGEVGDAFDPTRHEAVTHQTSAEVTAPTCVAVMRRGYQLGERLLRPALVAVADPESE
jgi:molecular chaperone GrpE